MLLITRYVLLFNEKLNNYTKINRNINAITIFRIRKITFKLNNFLYWPRYLTHMFKFLCFLHCLFGRMKKMHINSLDLDQILRDRNWLSNRWIEDCWDKTVGLSVSRYSQHRFCFQIVFWTEKEDLLPHDRIWWTGRCACPWTVYIF